jgi:hypothetical protein
MGNTGDEVFSGTGAGSEPVLLSVLLHESLTGVVAED